MVSSRGTVYREVSYARMYRTVETSLAQENWDRTASERARQRVLGSHLPRWWR